MHDDPIRSDDAKIGRLTRRRWLLAGSLALALSGCGPKAVRGRLVPTGATVLALGDSITYGTGAAPDGSYPVALAALTGWNVINAGVPGDVSAQALQRLPALLAEHRPELVLVSIGGNDLLRRMAEAQTRANIRAICEQARASGAQVLLIALPRPTFTAVAVGSLSDHPLYAELADELKLSLHSGGWSEVLSDASLKSDSIHANAQGYQRFAQGLANRARALGLLVASA